MSAPEPRSPFEPHWSARSRDGAGTPAAVTLATRRLAMATIEARKGRAAEVGTRIAASLGLKLPEAQRAAAGRDGTTAYATAPSTWLVAMAGAEETLVSTLQRAVGDAASIVDQSHGKTLLRISGARVRDVLDKICRLDLDASAFPPGRCGITHIAHVAVLIARADAGGAAEAPAFDLIIPSTFALTVLEAVETAAAEYGWVRGERS